MADGNPTRVEKLVALAREKFSSLTPAEERLLRHTANGQWAVFSELGAVDPSGAGQWKEGRLLQAGCIAWICTDPEAKQFLTHRGLLVAGARIDGELDLQFARVAVPLAFVGCAFPVGLNLKLAALDSLTLEGTHTGSMEADFLKVERTIFFRNGFNAAGRVSLLGASIGGDLNCSNGRFSSKDGAAFNAERMKIEGGVFLRGGFQAEGEVRLGGASIGGDLDCSNGRFWNKDGVALHAERMKVEGNVFLSGGFQAEGAVRLVGASIGRDLDCSNGRFSNKDGVALIADRMKVGGDVNLSKGFQAEGQVRLPGAFIGGLVDCSNARFSNKDGVAFHAERMTVKGGVFLRDGFQAEGTISLVGVDIGGLLQWRSVKGPETATLDLRLAKVKTLWDEKESWPPKDQIFLQGFVYEELFHRAPSGSEDRIEWLRRQREDLGDLSVTATRTERRAFFAQPYEQLASVLRKSGLEDDADRILIEKNTLIAKDTRVGKPRWWWYRVLGPPISFGYRPGITFRLSLCLILVGGLIFGLGFQAKLFSPAHEDAYKKGISGSTEALRDDYPRFNSFVYSAETFVPLVKFYQAEYWLPDANRGSILLQAGFIKLTTGGCLRLYLWVHTILGWTLTSIWVAGLTGVIKKKG